MELTLLEELQMLPLSCWKRDTELAKRGSLMGHHTLYPEKVTLQSAVG